MVRVPDKDVEELLDSQQRDIQVLTAARVYVKRKHPDLELDEWFITKILSVYAPMLK